MRRERTLPMTARDVFTIIGEVMVAAWVVTVIYFVAVGIAQWPRSPKRRR